MVNFPPLLRIFLYCSAMAPQSSMRFCTHIGGLNGYTDSLRRERGVARLL